MTDFTTKGDVKIKAEFFFFCEHRIIAFNFFNWDSLQRRTYKSRASFFSDIKLLGFFARKSYMKYNFLDITVDLVKTYFGCNL